MTAWKCANCGMRGFQGSRFLIGSVWWLRLSSKLRYLPISVAASPRCGTRMSWILTPHRAHSAVANINQLSLTCEKSCAAPKSSCPFLYSGLTANSFAIDSCVPRQRHHPPPQPQHQHPIASLCHHALLCIHSHPPLLYHRLHPHDAKLGAIRVS